MTASWPAWFYGPKGAAGIFDKEADVPKGWKDHPGDVAPEIETTDPFDHDGDGKPGGSLPKAKAKRKVTRRDARK